MDRINFDRLIYFVRCIWDHGIDTSIRYYLIYPNDAQLYNLYNTSNNKFGINSYKGKLNSGVIPKSEGNVKYPENSKRIFYLVAIAGKKVAKLNGKWIKQKTQLFSITLTVANLKLNFGLRLLLLVLLIYTFFCVRYYCCHAKLNVTSLVETCGKVGKS